MMLLAVMPLEMDVARVAPASTSAVAFDAVRFQTVSE